MFTLDLREIGPLTEADMKYLAILIAKNCKTNRQKLRHSWMAQIDFDWSLDKLKVFEVANLMEKTKIRVYECLCAGEFLAGVFGVGELLDREALLDLMLIVNEKQTVRRHARRKYKSGKTTWADAPLAIKKILDMLDDALVENRQVFVLVPTMVPLDQNVELDDLALALPKQLRLQVGIIWP